VGKTEAGRRWIGGPARGAGQRVRHCRVTGGRF
jgi:hypothetical protein